METVLRFVVGRLLGGGGDNGEHAKWHFWSIIATVVLLLVVRLTTGSVDAGLISQFKGMLSGSSTVLSPSKGEEVLKHGSGNDATPAPKSNGVMDEGDVLVIPAERQ